MNVCTRAINGLQASMQITMGEPYFLSELLPVEVSLSNHTEEAFLLDRRNRPTDYAYESALPVTLSGGEAPFYSFPQLDIGRFNVRYKTNLLPGQTLKLRQLVPLTRSKEVRLTMGATFLRDYSFPTASPLDGYWPSLTLHVNAYVPSTHAISLQPQGPEVLIVAPAAACPHLLYLNSITCESKFELEHGPVGGCIDGKAFWRPLSSPILRVPECPSGRPDICPRTNLEWKYAVSAPGFPIVGGSHWPLES
ncbi:hypothetical protein EPA93_34715 [Ktedonosporobacter rubrisoli]|uniref:Uncharacterized protein n=1 Tax=Ktedonosporobacter rubrisoli TaxID=2509675 RepID=A0A4P6K0C4_KTERU|nr:hypothetical protein [Ktedonosporobacter rubrisoli]QBD80846.1 hypothetical protein EPA93_34715 [Ktedonosporobacter rubrisoli]